MNDTLLEKVNGDILIVDDGLNNLQLLSDLLGDKGYEVRSAQNGQAALTIIDKDLPDLILLDIRIPEMDGYEVCERLKSDKNYRHIPIIFLSALQNTDDKVKAFEAGAVDFITKPFQAQEVLARVSTHIALSRLSRNFEEHLELRTANLIKTDEQLRMMKTAIEKVMDPIVFINPDGRYVYANEASVKESGYPRDKLLTLHTYDIGPEYTPEIWRDHFQELKRVGSMRLQNKIVTGNGDTVMFDARSNYVKIGEKEFIHSCGRDITELIMAQEALTEQLGFEKMIANISAVLTHTDPEDIDDRIDSILLTLGENLGTERVFLGRFTEENGKLTTSNIWAAEGIDHNSSIFNIDLADKLPWVAEQIQNGNSIHAGVGLADLPEEAKELRYQLEKDGINSGFAIPVQVESRSIGFLGFDTIDQPREFPPSIVDRVRIIADMIGSTLQRINAQALLNEQLRFEELISDLSSEFINLPVSDVDSRINEALKKIVDVLSLDRSSLFQFSKEAEILNLTHTFASESAGPSPPTILSSELPWFTKKLRLGEIVKASRFEKLPKEAVAERRWWKAHRLKSAMVLPLKMAGTILGAISFATIQSAREWPDELVKRLQMVSVIFSNVLTRKRSDEQIQNAFSEIEQLKERLEHENVYLREEVELQHQHGEIIGQSKATLQMLNQAEQVAETDSTVLIQGETGTGKELLARAIHRLSSRSHRAMITVNCAALPATLIESEMFGREKGAFTGALSGRIGRFEVADGSTIFLDEIGELTPDVQMKLLRVLEKGAFERLGSNKTIKVNVRIIAATNRDLNKAVQDGSFRRDLFYRLNVFPINVPPLQDRLEDLELLVWAFVKEYGEHMGKRITNIPKKSVDALKRCPWRGNIRELRNVIEQSMIVTKGSTLEVQLPGIQAQSRDQTVLLEDVERNHIFKILKQTGWRVRGKQGAAELLGLKPTTLESRMKKLQIIRLK